MKEVIVSALQIKRAICIATDDSQSGGRCHRMCSPVIGQLLLSVMGLYINLLAVDYPKVASDKRKCTSSIFAILAKALINTDRKLDFKFSHEINVSKLRAWSGFSRLHRPFDEKTGFEYYNSYPVILSALELASP